MTYKTTPSLLLHVRGLAAAIVALATSNAAVAADNAPSDYEIEATDAAASGTPNSASTAPNAQGANTALSNEPTAPANVSSSANPQLPRAPSASNAAPPSPMPSTNSSAPESLAAERRNVVAPDAQRAAAGIAAPPPATEPKPGLLQSFAEGLVLSGYFQSQYESHQDSEDQLRQGGALLNQNRFVLRRGRVRLARDWDYASLLVELDGNTVRGPNFRWQKAEASLVYGRSKEKDVAPLIQFTMGIFDLPFGYELTESPKFRPFMERSLGGRALWPSEPDVGARLSGQLKFFRYALAVSNGEPLDEKSGYGLQDPNKNKDVTIRLGAVANPWPKFKVSGDVTYNAGKGFHPGTDSTKPVVTWNDANHNGIVDASSNELIGSASAATPSQNFPRWALGADAQVALETGLGRSMLYGEVVVAQNMDRGLFIADPIATGGQNIRQLNYYVALLQDVTPYGLVGFRTDYYDPNSDFLDQRAGKLVPTSQAIRSYSPIVGAVLPDRAKLLFQWDIQSNLLARDSRGVPTRYPNNQWTLRLQVNL